MKCGYSRETLALYIEDDLPADVAMTEVEAHVELCPGCRGYCDELRKSQSLIRSRYGWKADENAGVGPELLANVRHNVMAQIETAQQSMGWALRLERFFALGFRRQNYAVIGAAVIAIVSASMFGQIRYAALKTQPDAVFGPSNALLCPTGYKEWVFLGCSTGSGPSPVKEATPVHNVYINPAAYREYKRSGKFPEGTVMVLEMLSSTKSPDVVALEVSVKDSNRFDGGWGFYDFTEDPGKLKPQADASPQTAGCMPCHRDKGATDHVFTQFYPVLKTAGS